MRVKKPIVKVRGISDWEKHTQWALYIAGISFYDQQASQSNKTFNQFFHEPLSFMR
jgi:nucleoside phosphorylase